MKKAIEQAKELLKALQENPQGLDELAKAWKGEMCEKCNKSHPLEKRCWEGYKPVKGKKPYSKGSCEPVKKEENPDKEADAKLGEDVEHLVEDHMMENKEAEMEEGHKIFKKDEMLARVKKLKEKKLISKSEEMEKADDDYKRFGGADPSDPKYQDHESDFDEPKQSKDEKRDEIRQLLQSIKKRHKIMSEDEASHASEMISERDMGQYPTLITKKAEHQPHPGASISEHQKIHDKKKQAEEEAHLKSPEGEKERQERNKKAMQKDEINLSEKKTCTCKNDCKCKKSDSMKKADVATYQKKSIKSKKVPENVAHTETAKGVHGYHWSGNPGESTAGMQIREKASMMTSPKDKHKAKLAELKAMPKPNLPKSEEMEKADMATHQKKILSVLKDDGWTVSEHPKVSHATKDGIHLWFKPKDIYFSTHNTFKGAKSLYLDPKTVSELDPKTISEGLYRRASTARWNLRR